MEKGKIYLGYVSTANGSLNLREGPSSSSEILKTIPKNTEVEVFDEPVNGWYKINYNGVEGYVSKKYITITGEKPTEKPVQPEPIPETPELTEYYGVFIPCRDKQEAENICKLYNIATVVNYKSFNGEDG